MAEDRSFRYCLATCLCHWPSQYGATALVITGGDKRDQFQFISRIAAIILGLSGATLLRTALGKPWPAASLFAGLIFAFSLLMVAFAYRYSTSNLNSDLNQFDRTTILTGIAGGVLLVTLAMWQNPQVRLVIALPTGNFWTWLAVLIPIVIGEELLLRGVLMDVLIPKLGNVFSATTAASFFALLHVSLYGWNAVPLDFGVGLWLGYLRIRTDSVNAPILAHLLADISTWWLV